MTPPPSLCQSCSFKRDVRGRHGQRYLLCRNETIDAKYPPQPVLACAGYKRLGIAGLQAPLTDDDAG